MLTSLAWVFLWGLVLGRVFERLKLPPLIGMMVAGMLIGPWGLGLLSHEMTALSGELRRCALIVILTRAGLALDVEDLIQVGRPAFLLCFVPATFELIGVVLLAPSLLGIGLLEAALLGAVVSAVSSAVVVPKMLSFMENGRGIDHGIPQLLIAGASVDNVYMIALFASFLGLVQGGSLTFWNLARLPVAVILGLVIGVLSGRCAVRLFSLFNVPVPARVTFMLSLAFLLVAGEREFYSWLPYSGLLAVMAMGVSIQRDDCGMARQLADRFSSLWVAAEAILFVLVGALVELPSLGRIGVAAVALLIGALVFRAVGVVLSLAGTKLTVRERFFCVVAFVPKATVQAAIGSLPLTLGLPCGSLVLAVSVLAILLTAPLGALGIDIAAPRCLNLSGTRAAKIAEDRSPGDLI